MGSCTTQNLVILGHIETHKLNKRERWRIKESLFIKILDRTIYNICGFPISAITAYTCSRERKSEKRK